MVVLNCKAFRLPRMDKDKFVNLLHMGLDYNRNEGTFSIKSYEKIEEVMETVSAILGSEVVFLQSCVRCGRDFACKECGYIEVCTTKNLPFSCVCPKCLRDRKQFEQYLTKF